jgi:acyl-CoA synthetase (AMP-forming)/AMP-acid ligase II
VQIVDSSIERARVVVSCGRPTENDRVAIVDPDSCEPCDTGDIGEIWVRGASVAAGYWHRDEETRIAFAAHLSQGEGPYLRTGDLGFLWDGELFVTGRRKDIILIHGACHYPEDVERTVEQAHAALRLGCVAAFGIEMKEEENVAVVAEVSCVPESSIDTEEIAARIRDAVGALHGLSVHTVVIVEAGTIPKTSSGKIRRQACRAGVLNGTLGEIARSVVGG